VRAAGRGGPLGQRGVSPVLQGLHLGQRPRASRHGQGWWVPYHHHHVTHTCTRRTCVCALPRASCAGLREGCGRLGSCARRHTWSSRSCIIACSLPRADTYMLFTNFKRLSGRSRSPWEAGHPSPPMAHPRTSTPPTVEPLGTHAWLCVCFLHGPDHACVCVSRTEQARP
jgi:hypothetical protein